MFGKLFRTSDGFATRDHARRVRHHLTSGRIDPDDSLDIRIALEQVLGSQLEQGFFVPLRREIGSQLLQLLRIAFDVKTDALLEPEHVSNQRRALLLGLVLA